MSIYEDVEDLKSQIRKSIDTQDKKSIADLLKQSFSLCEKIKEVIKESDEEERKKLSKSMQDFRMFLESEAKKLSKNMGLTQDQFAKYNETPENFSPEQWRGMQMIKQRFAAKTKEMRQTIRHHVPAKKGSSPSKLPELPENWRQLIAENPNIVSITPKGEESPKKKKKIAVRKIKKSSWIKS